MSFADKISNKAEDLAGKGKEAVGQATGDEQLQAEGKADQAKASIKDGFEKVKDAVSDIKDGLTK
ncbi:CsbD family protein [Nocardioides fonticola]|uniref:CsbD family protein n=1 Tax=Nocardioides fonticola TaxID=450363 RepID=A0ABP7XQH4_9ACTN